MSTSEDPVRAARTPAPAARQGRVALAAAVPVVAMFLAMAGAPAAAGGAGYVIHVSVDGLRPDAVTALTPAGAPNFDRLRREGAFTDNARTDADFTLTLPNHTSQLTGRPVFDRLGPGSGHGYTANGEPEPATVHAATGRYVASTFDVAHDRGLRTGMYATKDKFALYDRSYDATNGAPDLAVPPDDGRDKIDAYANVPGDSVAVVAALVADLGGPSAGRPNYAFVHLHDADSAGHAGGWDVSTGSAYLQAVGEVDRYLGQILAAIDRTPDLAGRTALLLTADHGGAPGVFDHSDPMAADNYTVPFYAWGAGVAAGDLYAMNPGGRADPGTVQPAYDAPGPPPIRNGEIGNLALDLLGLEPIPGSTLDGDHTLTVPEPGGALALEAGLAGALLSRRQRRGTRR